MSHPYISGAGHIASMIDQLRKQFPKSVDAGTVKRLGLASNNESYVINCLQFIGVINGDGKKTEQGTQAFSHHKDEDFQKAFSELIKSAYADLFELHVEEAWTLPKDDLIAYFRKTDRTSEAVGRRQAAVFQVFANKSGKLDDKGASKNATVKNKTTTTKPATAISQKSASKGKKEAAIVDRPAANHQCGDFGLSVKVEINLPSDATAETYDNIFKSIKKNLLNG